MWEGTLQFIYIIYGVQGNREGKLCSLRGGGALGYKGIGKGNSVRGNWETLFDG